MNRAYTKLCLVFFLCVIISSCKKGHNLTGMWHGAMSAPDPRNGGSADIDAALQQTDQGVIGSITWHHATGAWRALDDATFVINSGVVADDNVSITATDDLGGGKVTLNLAGVAKEKNLKGTASIGITSMMGGGTFPGIFELSKD